MTADCTHGDRRLRIKMDSALNRPVEDWGKLLGDVAAVSAMLDRLLHHGHILKCGPRSWRTKTVPTPP
jgi:DNA replication protein DnaC